VLDRRQRRKRRSSHIQAAVAWKPAFNATPVSWHATCNRQASRLRATAAQEAIMATLTIRDLNTRRELDLRAMSAIRGGGAQWVFGWIQPYTPPRPSQLPIVNFYEINYSFYADQMNNQFQNIDVRNNAPNSNVTVDANMDARNKGRLL